METIAISQWEDIGNVSRLVNDTPILGLRTINNGINEKARILVQKNLGINLNESLLFLPDPHFRDVVNAMLLNSLIDRQTAKQLIGYKKMLNYRHLDYLSTDIKKICTSGMVILGNL